MRRLFGRRRRAVLAGTVALLLTGAAALPAAAAADPGFQACDGLGTPRKSGEDLGRIVYGAPEQAQFLPPGGFGGAGITACDAALADLGATPERWRRRVNVLRARAIHRLALSDVAGALADLDAAEAAVQDPNDVFYQRDLKPALDLTRAYAQRRAGNLKAAGELAEAAWSRRSYSRLVSRSALRVLEGEPAFDPQVDRILTGLSRVSPEYVDVLFVRAFERGRFDEVVRLYPQLIQPDLMSWEPQDGEIFHASRAAYNAYALAALGRVDEARAALAAAQARLDKSIEPPAPVRMPEDPNAQDRERYQRKVAERDKLLKQQEARRAEAVPILAKAASLIEPGTLAPADGAHALQAVAAAQASSDPLRIKLRETMGTSFGETIQSKAPPVYSSDPLRSLAALLNVMTEVDTPNRIESLGSGDFWKYGSFETFKSKEPGVTVFTYRSAWVSSGMDEELPLLSAAAQAVKAGKPGLIVRDRVDFRHVESRPVYGGFTEIGFQGYQTLLYITFVDPSALPPGYEHAGWRVIDANAVLRELGPAYLPAPKPAT